MAQQNNRGHQSDIKWRGEKKAVLGALAFHGRLHFSGWSTGSGRQLIPTDQIVLWYANFQNKTKQTCLFLMVFGYVNFRWFLTSVQYFWLFLPKKCVWVTNHHESVWHAFFTTFCPRHPMTLSVIEWGQKSKVDDTRKNRQLEPVSQNELIFCWQIFFRRKKLFLPDPETQKIETKKWKSGKDKPNHLEKGWFLYGIFEKTP